MQNWLWIIARPWGGVRKHTVVLPFQHKGDNPELNLHTLHLYCAIDIFMLLALVIDLRHCNNMYIWATSRENLSSGLRPGKTWTSLLSQGLETLNIANIDTILSKLWPTKALIRLRGCAGWSAPLLFAYGKNSFSHDMAHLYQGIRKPAIVILSWKSNETIIFLPLTPTPIPHVSLWGLFDWCVLK